MAQANRFIRIDGEAGRFPTDENIRLATAHFEEFCANNFVGRFRWHKGRLRIDHRTDEYYYNIFLMIEEPEDVALFKLKWGSTEWQEVGEPHPAYWEWMSPITAK